MTINHNSDIPVYRQLEEIIESKIYDGTYKTGDKIPSENELCELYGVSRTTVRQTLTLLAQKDLVYSVHGKGSFVKLPEIKGELSKIVRFGTALKLGGVAGYTNVYKYDTGHKNEKADRLFNHNYFNLYLIGYAKDAPVVVYKSYIRDELKSDVYSQAKRLEFNREAFSTYDIYDRLNINIRRVEQRIGAVMSNQQMEEVLNLSAPMALIKLESIYYGEDKMPLEIKTAYYRSDVYSFEIKRDMD